MRRRQWLAGDHLVVAEVVEPILTRFETGDDGVTALVHVFAGVLARRIVAAADMPARRTSAQMEPPAA